MAGIGALRLRHLLRRPLRHDPSAVGTALRTEIDDIIRGFDQIEIVLDDNDRISRVHQFLKHLDQAVDIRDMQTRGRLVEDVDRPSCGPPGQLRRQLDALRLAAGERGRRLADLDIIQPHILKRLELAGNLRDAREKFQPLLYGHFQHVVDALALIFDFERLAVVAPPLAHVARDVDVRQKVHFDFDDPVALTGLAAAALDVEREPSGAEAAHLGVLRGGVKLADVGEYAGIRRRVGARRAPDGGLIDLDHLVERLNPADFPARAGTRPRAVEI